MILVLLVVGTLPAFAQKGKVTGKVIDAKTGEELVGVNVYLKGNSSYGTITDLDGRYILENLPSGTDTIVFRYISYSTHEELIKLKENQTLTINVAMSDKLAELGEVTITSKRDQQKINTFLLEKKNASVSQVGLTADVIKKAPDNNSGEAIKRVSGTTIQGGKFAIIRGLNERYNLAMINNSPLPSTEPEKRAFSLDLFPSNMLDQLVILKSSIPEYPADWAGGIILIRTRDVPENPFINVSVSGSYNSLATFQHFYNTEAQKNDWFGLGSSSRELGDNFPTTDEIFSAKNTNRKQLVDYANLLPNNYGYNSGNALPNGGVNLSAGRNFKILNNNRLGLIFSGLYGTGQNFKPVERNWWTTDGLRALNYFDSTYEKDVKVGAMLNLTYNIGSGTKLSFKNTYNHSGEDQFTVRSGTRDAEGTFLKSYSYQYTFNRMFYSQLAGEHLLGAASNTDTNSFFKWKSTKIEWELGLGNTIRSLPDYRNVEYQTQDPENSPYRLKLLPQNGSEDVSRLFTTLNEDIKSVNVKVETPYKLNANLNGSIKVGYFHQYKKRVFDGRFLSYSRPSMGFQFSLLQLPVDEIFDNSSFFYESSSGPNGILMDEITRPYHSYFAESALNALFLQFETRVKERHRFIYGVRQENYHQILDSKGQNGEPVRIDTVWLNLLPSINYVFQATDKVNIRSSYFRSLSRPDFRELAPFAFLDFQSFSILRGNPALNVTQIDNFELSYELYPNAGELFSVSLFYKRFEDPIELLLDNSITLGAIGRLYQNLPLANSLGVEFDIRKNLGFLDSLGNTQAFGHFTIYGNVSIIKSEIDLKGETNTFNSRRPMQGQSPYIANFGIEWEADSGRWVATALFNRFGERIYNVGTATLPDIYEKARSVIDFQISRKFLKNSQLELKLSIQDILAQKLIYFFDFDSNQRFNADIDREVYSFRMPRTIGIGASYRF